MPSQSIKFIVGILLPLRNLSGLMVVLGLGSALAASAGPPKGPGTSLEALPSGVYVAPMIATTDNGSEMQSTVVPPGANASCPGGRILITNDLSFLNRPVALFARSTDIVTGYDLEAPFAAHSSTFEIPYPKDAERAALSNWTGQDHDILTLKNGDVLLLDLGESTSRKHVPYPNAKDDWWPWAFAGPDGKKITLGPGLRTTIYVWRSTDCGATFHWASEIDPANVQRIVPAGAPPALADGSCAMPQTKLSQVPPYFAKVDGIYTDEMGNLFTASTFEASFKGFYQGGTDGPLARVDPRDGSVWLTFGCVGNVYQQDPSGLPYGLGAPLNKTAVFRSGDGGENWAQAGELPVKVWRGSILPYGKNQMIFSAGIAAMIATVQTSGALAFNANDPAAITPPLTNTSGWPVHPPTAGVCIDGNFTWSNFVARGPVIAGVQTLLLSTATHLSTFPPTPAAPNGTTVQWGNGQDLILYNPVTKATTALRPVVPASHSPKDYVVHLTAVDLGSGPLLLYWLDANAAHVAGLPNEIVSKPGSAMIMGRLIYSDGSSSADFVISRTVPSGAMAPAVYSWSPRCSPPGADFYGDYHTASGFVTTQSTAFGSSTIYHFFPLWVEPGAGARFAEVDVVFGSPNPGLALNKQLLTLAAEPAPPPSAWRPAPRSATLAEISRQRLPGEADAKALRRREGLVEPVEKK